jgi:protein SCO1/2
MLSLVLSIVAFSASQPAVATVTAPAIFTQAAVRDTRGSTLPLDTPVYGHNGDLHPLRDWVDPQNPAVLTFNYAGCPMLCGLQQDGLAQTLDGLPMTPGTEFDLLTIGIDPTETPDLGRQATEQLSARVGGQWIFLTAPETSVTQLTEAAGFSYQYDPTSKQYAHPTATYIVSPDGQISQFFTALQPNPRDLRLALVEASNGQVGSVLDQVALTCLQYDTTTNAYVAKGVMRSGGFAIMGGLLTFFGMLWYRDRKPWGGHNV